MAGETYLSYKLDILTYWFLLRSTATALRNSQSSLLPSLS